MKKYLLFTVLFVLLSCASEKSKPPTPPQKTSSNDKVKYPLPKKMSEKDYIKKLQSKDCVKFVECYGPKEIAKEMGKTEEWAVKNYFVTVWGKPTNEGKFPKVGSMRCGSRALLIEERGDDYKILSPLDGSIGWVNEIQISKVISQNPTTFEKCEG